MKLHLNFLSKQEEIENKKIKTLYGTSLQIANNKINHVSTHLFVIVISYEAKATLRKSRKHLQDEKKYGKRNEGEGNQRTQRNQA